VTIIQQKEPVNQTDLNFFVYSILFILLCKDMLT